MENMHGGDFSKILEKYGCFDTSIVRFYLAELILAV